MSTRKVEKRKVAVDVQNVTVRFNQASEKIDSLKEYMVKLVKRELMFKEFLALEDVSMTVHRGEAWGLVGTNGAGKSTLLKLICGILAPHKGTVSIHGSIAPLIELGAGFDQNLTAGENIFLNGAILGYNKTFMQAHYDEIVDFAELHKFMDMPIKNYSSGMRARLGFAIATVVKPEILIVDEVLAVGDAAFQKKCTDRMDEMLSNGTTLLFVSHSVPQVRQLCDHVLWLDHGRMRMYGEANEVCTEYEKFLKVPVSAQLTKPEPEKKKAAPSGPPHYDYLVVGAGLSGATFAYEMARRGRKVLVLEKRDTIGGNAYTEDINGIHVHKYGPHIFHTDDAEVWKFMNHFTAFNAFVNSPVANYKGELYNLPFNMNTFNRMWGVITPEQAAARLAQEREQAGITGEPKNLEEQAISLVGRDVYEKLVKGYTEKQWGRPCDALPPEIIKRLPVRYTYDNNYFNSQYQGIPEDGYTPIVEQLLARCEVRLETNYLADKAAFDAMADKVVYTGPLDAYFGYSLGNLEYRSLRFEQALLEEKNHQGVAVMNYTDADTPYTRTIEHKHFYAGKQFTTVITHEYPQPWEPGLEPYYPINDEKNEALCAQYQELCTQEPKTIFLGRLAKYRYMDMDKAVREAMDAAEEELKKQ